MPKNLGNCAVFDKGTKLPTNDRQQLLNNSGYGGIVNNLGNKNKPVLIKNADVSIGECRHNYYLLFGVFYRVTHSNANRLCHLKCHLYQN